MTYSNAALEESGIMDYETPSAVPREPLQLVWSSSYTGDQRWKAESELDEIYNECKTAGWDGYDARGVTRQTYEVALEFLNKLPAFVMNPEVAADPDGELSFEWFKSHDLILTVSVSSRRKLSFAGTFQSTTIRGIENFGLEIPQPLLRVLSEHFSRSSASLI